MRLNCCVPFCKRTRGDRKGSAPIRDGQEWLCGEHWQMIPKVNRRAYGRYARRWRRFGFTGREMDARRRLWCWMKRYATERAVGL